MAIGSAVVVLNSKMPNSLTTDARWSLFSTISQTFWPIWQIVRINFGIFLAELSAPILALWVHCPCFPLINHYFYKKLSLYLYPYPKYLFRIGIWIWAAKNYGFCHRVSVVRAPINFFFDLIWFDFPIFLKTFDVVQTKMNRNEWKWKIGSCSLSLITVQGWRN